MAPADKNAAAEELFAEFLDRIEAGEAADFGAFCAAHPDHRTRLLKMHVRWLAMTQAFSALQTDGKAPPPSAALAALRQRLAGQHRATRYALGAEINRGAMGRIVAAFDQDLQREVAVKVHRGALDDERRQRRFLQEAQIAAQLDHPGIVPIHELGFDQDGRPFFSMQLVRGRDLAAILIDARDGRDGWSRTRVLLVLLRVCEAMAFAHSKGVVHRDLKPHNIMVGRFGETYVMDWGLARVTGSSDDNGGAATKVVRSDLSAEATDAELTQDGDIVGTPAYMAPEQASGGSRLANPAVDVYAVGAILYHLLAGHMPFANGTDDGDAILQRLRQGPPERVADDVPPELRAIQEQAMARMPGDRYPSMAALADDLRAFLELRTVSAYATGRYAELRKWIARNRSLTAMAALLLLALGVSALGITRLWWQAAADRDRADAGAVTLQRELEKSQFRAARLALLADNSVEAGDALWRSHLLGGMPRATSWALRELAERDPYLIASWEHRSRPVAWVMEHQMVAVGGEDGSVRLLDPTTLAVRHTIEGIASPLIHLAELRSAPLLAAGYKNGEVAVFDIERHRLERRWRAHENEVDRLLATGDQGAFASGGRDGRVLWWANPRAEPVELLRGEHGIVSLAEGPDGAILAGDRDGWLRGRRPGSDWQLERQLIKEQSGRQQVTALRLAADGHTLWVGSNDHFLRRMDLLDPTAERAWPSRNGTVRQLAVDTDGSVLVGGWWRTDRLLPDADRTVPVALRGPGSMSLDARGRRLLTSGSVAGIGIVDLSQRDRRLLPVAPTTPSADGIALSADGRRHAQNGADGVSVHDVDDGATVQRLPHAQWLRLSTDGSRLLGTRGDSVVLHEIATGTVLATVPKPPEQPFDNAYAFAPDGNHFAVCQADGIHRYRTSDGGPLSTLPTVGARAIRIAYSGNGRYLAVLERGVRAIRRHDLGEGGFVDVPFDSWADADNSTLAALAISTDGQRLAAGNWQGSVQIRDLTTGAHQVLRAHAGTIWSLLFAADDPDLLFTAGGAQGIAAWDLATGERCYEAVGDRASRVQLSNDGRTLACQTTDGALLLDLSYRERHLANNLGMRLQQLRSQIAIAPAREAELRRWAATVLARPWPRWR